MSELERLDEALSGRAILSDDEWDAVVLDAARAYRDLLANGQRVEWCEAHEAMDAGFYVVEGVCTIAAGFSQRAEHCRFVSKLLSVYPKEAENE